MPDKCPGPPSATSKASSMCLASNELGVAARNQARWLPLMSGARNGVFSAIFLSQSPGSASNQGELLCGNARGGDGRVRQELAAGPTIARCGFGGATG